MTIKRISPAFRKQKLLSWLCYTNIGTLMTNAKENFDKLKGYIETSADKLKVNDHIRYTTNKYKEEGRKIAYGVVKSINPITVNSYKDIKYANWKLDVNNKYKGIRLYIKKDEIYSGFCVECNEKIDTKYEYCFTCLKVEN